MDVQRVKKDILPRAWHSANFTIKEVQGKGKHFS